MKKALIIVDMQNDFVIGGALGVAGGWKIAERIHGYVYRWAHIYDKIVFTKDWHKAWPDTNGGHFSTKPDFKDSWPEHCVAHSEGSRFVPLIQNLYNGLQENGIVDSKYNTFYKGFGQPDYSGFQGKNNAGHTLDEFLNGSEISQIDIVGIAGDHCVKATAEDGINLFYQVNILPDMVASVGGDIATATTIKQL